MRTLLFPIGVLLGILFARKNSAGISIMHVRQKYHSRIMQEWNA
ncbi:hypothetical protein BDE02_04G174800 [Populus trichocarpa]|nr:hypothetical protein BDE02_04G174800 [Populus trichocarpa]